MSTLEVKSNLPFPVSFLAEVRDEVGRVTWPTWKATRRATIIVVVASAVTGAYIGGLDLAFAKLATLLLK
jgi:preprotein translocase SecE subunit